VQIKPTNVVILRLCHQIYAKIELYLKITSFGIYEFMNSSKSTQKKVPKTTPPFTRTPHSLKVHMAIDRLMIVPNGKGKCKGMRNKMAIFNPQKKKLPLKV
jgi:hypothetical protein